MPNQCLQALQATQHGQSRVHAHSCTLPYTARAHVEEALKKAVGGAEPTPKPRDGSVLQFPQGRYLQSEANARLWVLEEALQACILDVARTGQPTFKFPPVVLRFA